MKSYLTLLLSCLLTLPALGQAETLLGRAQDVSFGGFGGPVLRFTSIDGTPALLVGGRGGGMATFGGRHAFTIGGGGYGLVTEVKAEGLTDVDGNQLYLNLGYGGLELEYVNRPNRLVHLAAQVLIGAGGANYRDRNIHEFDQPDVFFALEPGLNLMLNVTDFFRIGAGASYRYITGTNLEAFSDVDLSGPSGMLTFKFGKF